MPSKRIINVAVLPGEPLDGSGKVCIHLFLRDTKGLFIEPHVLQPVMKNGTPVSGMVEARPTRGRLACDRVRTVATRINGTMVTITPRTDDPRAVTCPKCKASAEWHTLMDILSPS